MSIEMKIALEEERLAKSKDRQIRIETYLKSDKVRDLFTRYFNSSIDAPCFIECNDKFSLFLSRHILELYEYRKIEVDERLTTLPILRSIFVRRRSMKELSYASSFRLEFDENGSYKIDRLVASLSADELIRVLDELLFEKGTD